MKNIKEIEKEFDGKFAVYHFTSEAQRDRVKSFLSSSLLSQLEDIQKYIEKEKKRMYGTEGYTDGCLDALSDLSTYIDSLK